MGDVVSLRRARKRRARDGAEERAARNRAVHGRTKAGREASAAEADRAARALDGAALTTRGDDGPPEPDDVLGTD